MRATIAVLGFVMMGVLLTLGVHSFMEGRPEQGGVMIAIAAVCFAGAVTAARGE